MRKFSFRPGIFVLIAVLFTVVFIACRKIDQKPAQQTAIEKQASKNFFSVSSGTDYIVHTIAKKIYKQNERNPFTQALVKRVGYPNWDRSLIAGGPGRTRPAAQKGNIEQRNDQRVILYIPFAKEAERKTKAVLRVVIDKADTTFEMLYPQQYKKYGFNKVTDTEWDAQDLFNVFANFDYELFGVSKFLVKDGRIFGKKKSDLLIVERRMKEGSVSDNNHAARMAYISVCAYTTACVYASENTDDGGNCITTTSCTTYWYDDVTGSGSNTGGGSPVAGGGGGSGDGDSWPDDPCNNPPVVQRAPISDPTDTGDPCGDEPWEPFDDEIYNEVNDPCIKSMVQEAINRNCKNQISTFINSTFDKNPTMDITFIDAPLGNLITGDGITSGHIGGSGDCYITITLNSSPGTLPGASREYIAATIFHEAVHAWIIATNTTSNASNSVSHGTMTSPSNINMLATTLKEIYPGLSLQDANDLAWGGLQETAGWAALSQTDKDRINQTNFDYRNHTKGAPCIP